MTDQDLTAPEAVERLAAWLESHADYSEALDTAATLRALSAAREAERERIENANQAMSETQPSWEYRCHAIMAALGCNYGGPTPDIPEEHTWYAQNLARHKARAEAAEAARDQAILALASEAQKRGEAEGRLAASEMPGMVDSWKRRAEAAEAKLKGAKELLSVALKAVNWSFSAGTEEREGGSARRQGKELDRVREFEDNARAFLASMEKGK